jgi:hypothetical protein
MALVFAGAVERVARVLDLGADQRDARRFRLLRGGEIEHAFGIIGRRGALRVHGEIFRIFEALVCSQSENADCGPVGLYDRRHRRGDDVGTVRPDQQIDFVHAHELGVDRRRVRRIALVIVVDQLDRTPQQTAFGVDVVTPDFQTGQDLLARRRGRAAQAQTQSDP